MLNVQFAFAQGKPVLHGETASEKSEKNVPPLQNVSRAVIPPSDKRVLPSWHAYESLCLHTWIRSIDLSQRLADKLKRIEKLAKKVGGELNH